MLKTFQCIKTFKNSKPVKLATLPKVGKDESHRDKHTFSETSAADGRLFGHQQSKPPKKMQTDKLIAPCAGSLREMPERFDLR